MLLEERLLESARVRVAGSFLVLTSLAVLSGVAAADPLSPDTVWTPEARASAPEWVRFWIGFMFAVFGSGLLLVWRHPTALWMLGAFIASHLASGIEILLLDVNRLTVGLIAINHCVFWTPAAIIFHRQTRGTEARSLFGAWRWLALATAAFSLIFDYRDAALYLITLVSCSSALGRVPSVCH